jgi:Rad3-related DNA helicase
MREVVEQFAWSLHHRQDMRGANSLSTERTTAQMRDGLLAELIAGVDRNQIVLAEGSTGLGKSQILARTAQHILGKDPESVVWVATLTTNLVGQLLREFKIATPDLEPAVLIGRQQFISVTRTRAAVEDQKQEKKLTPATEAKIIAWLDSGAPPSSTETKTLKKLLPLTPLSHLANDLTELAGGELNVSDCLLLGDADSGEDEPAVAVLFELKVAADNARLVLCTQSMLLLRRKMVSHNDPLPCTHVLIDEAHELENSAARLYSAELSLTGLRSWLRQSKLSNAAQAITGITELIGFLQSDKVKDGYRQDEKTVNNIQKLLAPIERILKSARNGDAQERKHYASVIKSIVEAQRSWIGMSFSPVRRFPSITTGPQSVDSVLKNLWNHVEGAALVSGTVFVPAMVDGEKTSGYVSSKLAIPETRSHIVGPIIAPWVTTTTKLMIPDASIIPSLCYPLNPTEAGRSDKEDESEEKASVPTIAYQNWADAIAKQIAHSATSAKGGSLVLATAFRDVNELKARLSPLLGERLLTHDRSRPVQTLKHDFIDLHRRGLRPVWLAAGPTAWTGLDLRDRLADGELVPASADFLLTDLLIVRAGWGGNRSSTQFGREQAKKIKWFSILSEAAITLRQGIGRLIRAEGLTDRRLWVLDGRLFSPDHLHLAPTAAVFDRYTNRESFAST